MTGIASTTALLCGLLGVAVLIALAAERLRVPSAVALVAFGAGTAALHPVTLPFPFGPALLFVLLPPLIFEASWTLDLDALRRCALRIAVLAGPGVVLVAALTAAGIAGASHIPFSAAFVIGAIVAATDPVAVIAIFRRLPVPRDLQTIVEGESIANDGVALALTGVALAFASGGAGGGALVQAGLGAVLAIVVGIAAGACWAGIGAIVLRGTQTAEIEVTTTVVLAYLAYLSADALHGSGIFATAAAAVTLRALLRRTALVSNEREVDGFWSALAFIANGVVFLIVGFQLDIVRLVRDPALVAVALAIVILSRAVLAVLVLRDRAWRITFVAAGMRGGLSLALVLALPGDLPERTAIVDAVVAIVLFTVIVQGIALEPLLARLRFQSSSGGPSLSS